MPINAVQLAADLNAALSGFVPLGMTPASMNDEYELYIYSLVIKAAQAFVPAGATVTLVNELGNPVTSLITDSNPRLLTATGFTHFRITFPHKKPIEAHVGVYVRGISLGLHECDIALIEETEALNCRNAFAAAPHVQVDPDVTALIAFFECKCYITSLSLNIGRAFVGLLQEFKRPRTRGFLVTTRHKPSIKHLLEAYGAYHAHGILVKHSNTLGYFKYKLKQLFEAYMT